MSSKAAKTQIDDTETDRLLNAEGVAEKPRMQGYGAVVGTGGGAKAQEAAYPATPSAPPAFDATQGAYGKQPYPPQEPGYPPSGQGYPPGGQGYPPGGQGYPPGGQGYPPGGQGNPPGGQGYPPAGQGYPPAGQGYPPGGQGYPPAGQGYPPAGQGYPPSGQGYPPGGQGYPPGGKEIPPAGPMYPSDGQGYPPAGGAYPSPGPGYQSGGSGYPQGGPAGDGGAVPFVPPPVGFLDPVPGYDSITFDDIPLLPPSYDEATRPAEPKNRQPLNGVAVISQVEAKGALLKHCSANCCYGSTAAEEMIVSNMSSTSAFHYTLETFTEQRATAWAQVPFSGVEPLDTAMNGPAPMPWDIQIFATEKFKTEKKKVEVPHTACVKPCHSCQGCGFTRCTSCHGQGRSRCSSCSGGGMQRFGSENRRCTFCSGSGHRQCFSCSGRGRIRCNLCRGCGRLKWFIQLTVTWTNHFDDYILERTEMPDELIRKASGQTAFQEEQPWIYPINHCPEVSVNRASSELIEKHKKSFPNERQLLQRQTIRIVPVTEVHSLWKQKPFTFFVYGLDHLVYTADYPQMCCCGCTIL